MTCVASIMLGFHGNISVTANVAPRLMHEMCVAAATRRCRAGPRDPLPGCWTCIAICSAKPTRFREVGCPATRVDAGRYPLPLTPCPKPAMPGSGRDAACRPSRLTERTNMNHRFSRSVPSDFAGHRRRLQRRSGNEEEDRVQVCGQGSPLEVPPDPAGDARRSLCGSGCRGQGRATFSAYSAGARRRPGEEFRGSAPGRKGPGQRSGNQRWLVVAHPRTSCGVRSKGFLAENGFIIAIRTAGCRRDGNRLGGGSRQDR